MAIGNMLIYFVKGTLPWKGLKADSLVDKINLISKSMKNTTEEDLTSGLPSSFYKYYCYVKNLEFDATPNYKFLRGLFKGTLERY